MARRLVERGVRFVELIDSGSNRNWDSHGNVQDHVPRAKDVDKPITGLLRDLNAKIPWLFGQTNLVVHRSIAMPKGKGVGISTPALVHGSRVPE